MALTLYDFQGFLGFVVLKLVRKFNMEKLVVKELLYGGLKEIITNQRFFYYSTIGSGFSHFTDEGLEAVQSYMQLIAHKILEAEQADLDYRAKELVLKQLKN